MRSTNYADQPKQELPPEPDREIPISLASLDKNLISLRDSIESLSNRLSPLMTPSNVCEPPVNTEPTLVCSPIAEKIKGFQACVYSMEKIINSLNQRVQI
jgi:hypothetical protein